MRYSATILASLALACDSSGPGDFTLRVSASPTSGLPAPPSFLAEAPQLVIRGTIDLTLPCYEFTGSLDEAADTLVVTLHATRQDRPCVDDPALFNYTLTISGVKAGVQPLRLVYSRLGPPTYDEIGFEGAVDIK